MSNLQVQNVTSLAVNVCRIYHKHPQWVCVPLNLLLEQRKETRISADISPRAIHSPLTLCQNTLLLEYSSFWALLPWRLSSQVRDMNEMLCLHAGLVGTGHTLLCVCLTAFTNNFPYWSLGLESKWCSVFADLWYCTFLITAGVRIIEKQKSVKWNHCIWIVFAS